MCLEVLFKSRNSRDRAVACVHPDTASQLV